MPDPTDTRIDTELLARRLAEQQMASLLPLARLTADKIVRRCDPRQAEDLCGIGWFLLGMLCGVAATCVGVALGLAGLVP